MKKPSGRGLKTFVGMVLLAVLAVGARAATDVRSVAPGGTFEIAATDTFAKTQGSTSYENVLYFEGDGTLKITGSGDVCKSGFAVYATNGTLTVDLSGFSFKDQSKKVYWPMGGLLCNENGQLNVSGVDTVLLGASATGSGEPVYTFNDVNFGGAEVVLTNRAALGTMPSRATVPWKVASNMIYLSAFGVDMSELCDANGEMSKLPATTLSVAKANSFDAVRKVGVDKGQTLRVYLTGFYKGLNMTTSTGAQTTIHSPYSWGGQTGQTLKPDIELLTETSSLSHELRGVEFAGKVTGPGSVKITCTGVGSSRKDWTIFTNVVDVAELRVRGDTKNDGKSRQTVAFEGPSTIGKIVFYDEDKYPNTSTNIRLRVSGSLTVTGGTELTAASAEVPYADWTQVQLVKPGAKADLGQVSGGVASVRDGGELTFSGLARDAALYVHPEVTVADTVAAAYFEETVDDPAPGTVVRAYRGAIALGGKTGTIDIQGSGPVTLIAEPGESDVVVNLNGATARVETEETGWNDDENIIAWFDFSNEATWHQVTTTWDPPTCVQDSLGGNLTFLDGDQKMTLKVDGMERPLLDEVVDCRGDGFSNRLYNGRMYTNNAEKTGTNEFWSSVYPYGITNAGQRVNGNAYLAFGATNNARRLIFTPSLYRSASITYVFNVENGGGTAPIADANGYLGRETGAESAILSNNTCDVWVNGVKVDDPTTTPYPAGWCVVTVQPKDQYVNNLRLDRIGGTNAKTVSSGQMLGEVVVMSARPTDGQRYALESRLAKKWGIANVPMIVSSLAVKGSGSLEFAADVTLGAGSDASGLTYGGVGDIVLKDSAALPASFADAFDGVVTLDFPSLSFTLAGDTVENPLDVTPAKLSIPNEMNVLLDGTGTGLLELLTCGGFVGEPTWTLGEAGRGKLLSDETTLRLKCSSGVIILFR